jgi:hypothetical protein
MCNLRKGKRETAIDPVSSSVERLFDPIANEWSAHFEWANDQLTIIGLTPIGRATVYALLMNIA